MQIQKLGLEIRKIGNVQNLYSDVDMVLRNANVPSQGINLTVQQQTVAHSLQKMLNTERHCDVCTIRTCAELCQICISSERMKVYSAMHCVNWSDMLADFRQLLIAMILDDFRCVLCPS